jgi:hypothetical protein
MNTKLNATSHFGFDFSRIPIHARTPNEGTADATTHDKRETSSNLDGIRLHTDERASAEAEAINAAAYAKGKDIFFGAGRYQPKLPAGQRLLFHEMAHVVQHLMPTNSQGLKAGNWNLTYTREVLLIMCFMLFRSWKADQQSGFRILLADFANSRGGFTPNELSSKLEAAVGMAASPFNPATSGSSGFSGPGGLQLSNPTGSTGP